MNKLDVLITGDLQRTPEEEAIRPYSTSVLITSDDGHRTVVDTSAVFMRDELVKNLAKLGLKPSDVNTVILTHSHDDHTGNVEIFKKARILIHSGGNPIPGAKIADGIVDIAKGISLMGTPGHTPDSMSVMVDIGKTYIIAGDAVPLKDNYVRNVPPAVNYDVELALDSLKRIVKYADVIVPGHGAPFAVGRR